MRFKSYILHSAILGFALGLESCSDFLEVESLNEIVLENFWQEENDVENVVAGCYSALQSSAVIERMMAWGEFRSDNIVAGLNTESNVDLQNLLKETINPNNSYCDWSAFYDVINRCNTVLYYAPVVAERDPNYTQSELMATRAEMTALRDLLYFYLIRSFKDVPFSQEAYLDDTKPMDIAATPFYDVLHQLIADLEAVRPYAVKKYPDTNAEAQCGRITQNTIDAMLCEMYLWNKDYVKAVESADRVIKSLTDDYQKQLDMMSGSIDAEYQMIDGYPLISEKMSPYYGNAYCNIFGQGCSRESIFELVYQDTEGYLVNGAVSGMYGNATTFPGLVKPADFIAQDVPNEQYSVYLNKFDARYYENILEESSSLYGIQKYAGELVYLTATASQIKQETSGVFYNKDFCRANWILYRLTDVMLLKAEALVQQVTTQSEDALSEEDQARLQQALAIVNTINKRACCSSTYTPLEYSAYSSKSMMENLVLSERQRELMFEGKRWFDLVRRSMRDENTNYLLTAVIRKGSDNASVVRSKLSKIDALFLPYHEDELKVNHSLVQNPAYASSTKK